MAQAPVGGDGRERQGGLHHGELVPEAFAVAHRERHRRAGLFGGGPPRQPAVGVEVLGVGEGRRVVVPGLGRVPAREPGAPRLEVRFGVAICVGLLATLWDLRSGALQQSGLLAEAREIEAPHGVEQFLGTPIHLRIGAEFAL